MVAILGATLSALHVAHAAHDRHQRRLVASATTLLGLVKHAAFVERVWFQVRLEGRSRADVGVPETVEESFALADDDTIDSIRTEFRRACEQSRASAARHSFDDLLRQPRSGDVSVRWMYVHLVQELARHAGHGDILREQVLAARAD